MIIVKLSNGNVVLKDASGNVLKRLENHSYLQVVSSNAIEVYNNADKITTIYVSEVTGTQIEPAGVIAFVGDVYDLMDILTNSFFFISSGGGTVNAIDVNYNNTVSGLTATNVQSAIDEVDNIIDNLDATQIDYSNISSGLTSTNVQNAIDELNNQNYKEIYPVNWWNDFINTNLGVQNLSQSANTIRYQNLYIKKKVKVDRIRVTVTTPAASGTGVVGIYKQISNTGFGNPINMQLIAQANGTINLASATTQEILFASTLTLDEGIYFVSTWLSNTASFRTLRVSDNIYGRSPSLTDYFITMGQTSSTYTGTLPASTTVTGLDMQNTILVLFKIVP